MCHFIFDIKCSFVVFSLFFFLITLYAHDNNNNNALTWLWIYKFWLIQVHWHEYFSQETFIQATKFCFRRVSILRCILLYYFYPIQKNGNL